MPPKVHLIFLCCGRCCRNSSLAILLREFFARSAPPFEPRKRRFRRDLTTSKFWSSNQRVLPLFLGLLAQNGRLKQAQMQRGDQKRVWKILRAFGSVFSARTTPCGGPRTVFQTAAFIRLVPNNSLPKPSRAFSGHSHSHSQCLRHRMRVEHNDAASLQTNHIRHPSKRIEEESKSPP